MSEEFGCGLAECLGLRVRYEFAVKVSARAVPSEGRTVAGGPASKTAPLTAGKLVLAGGLCVLTTWRLASPRASDPREQGSSCNVSYDPPSGVTSGLFHNILLLNGSALFKVGGATLGRKYQAGWVPGSRSATLIPCLSSHPHLASSLPAPTSLLSHPFFLGILSIRGFFTFT